LHFVCDFVCEKSWHKLAKVYRQILKDTYLYGVGKAIAGGGESFASECAYSNDAVLRVNQPKLPHPRLFI
jgi:hypothetical protein